jgi:hypothetical protein
MASLKDKPTAKDAWDSIAATRVSLDSARKATVQKLRQEWDRLAFWLEEDVDNFALRLSGLVQHLMRHGDIDEQKVVEKYLRVVPKKYTQIALSMETLLDLSNLSHQGGDRAAQGNRQPRGSTSCQPCLHRRQVALHRGAVAHSPEGEEEAGGLVFVQGSPSTTAQEEQ